MGAVASKSQRWKAGASVAVAGGVGEFDTTVQALGAMTLSWKLAFRSGCSKQAYMRRASAVSNCV